ncbi:MAG: SDR family NAD(P)-dependent oxidoreductase [Candidatus Devosia phytovorans]|uniref:SDR family NAD(P)-dependent oxidoreductase n=1 Tax=Candidatus Devosia phytovorans TaxID=3121372 RepID=A0AAJ6AZX7_9HYPH|nr:SDR family NAD(P)-dependent oxidoreductase [Devosia sp.]WEK03594.1 MAG: SDR family NAD(P)-dependent oxidoreductase [Devosia sp.]
MQTTGNTILITGGGSGIGRGLAEAFHAQGNQVIISGRRQSALDEVVAANPGMAAFTVDMTDPASILDLAAKVIAGYPALDAVIHNAGIMVNEDVLAGTFLPTAEDTIATNLLGPIRLTAALLPHLQAQPKATVLTVSSGLAFVPKAETPTYSATKAAIHSWTQSLRHQLRNIAIEVLEIAPPYVQTYLQGEHQANDPNAMPLAEYLTETMQLLAGEPENGEVLVQRVHRQRFAEQTGNAKAVFGFINPA